MPKLVRCGGNIGNKADSIRYLYCLDLLPKGYKIFALESRYQSLGQTSKWLIRLFNQYFFKRADIQALKQPSVPNGSKIVFRSSSILLNKILLYSCCGRHWKLAFVLSEINSFVFEIYVRSLWVFSNFIPISRYRELILRNAESVVAGWDGTFKDEFVRHLNSYLVPSPSGSESFKSATLRLDCQDAAKKITEVSYLFAPPICDIDSVTEKLRVRFPDFDVSKLVVIHFRTNEYLNDIKNFRNCDHVLYINLARYLVNQGYFPVFIGSYSDSVMSQIEKFAIHVNHLSLPQIYDEVALVRDCQLFIKSCTGPQYLTGLFWKNSLALNYPYPFVFDWETQNSRFLLKYFYVRNSNRYMAYREILDLPLMDYIP